LFVHSASDIVITKVLSANRLLHSPVGVTTYRHQRERWALALKVEGKTIYTIEGKDIVSDSTHPVILAKGSNYSWKCIRPGACLIIEFEAISQQSECLSFEVSDSNVVSDTFYKIEKRLNGSADYQELECISLLSFLLLSLLKSNVGEYATKNQRQKLSSALRYIEQNYFDGGITNELLAQKCGMSTVYFRKMFFKVYGASPIHYLSEFRIKKAKSILKSDYDSIEQVAQSVGYNSIYHFSKMFKQYVGVSPTEYAKLK